MDRLRIEQSNTRYTQPWAMEARKFLIFQWRLRTAKWRENFEKKNKRARFDQAQVTLHYTWVTNHWTASSNFPWRMAGLQPSGSPVRRCDAWDTGPKPIKRDYIPSLLRPPPPTPLRLQAPLFRAFIMAHFSFFSRQFFSVFSHYVWINFSGSGMF